jgi:hypothetical protein
MRRVLGAVVALMCVGLLSSCSVLPLPTGSFRDTDEQKAAAQMQHIADAVKDHDAAALKKLFSPRARKDATDLDGGLTFFLSAFPSGPVTWTTEGTGNSGEDDLLKHATELFGNYKVSANGKKYDLYFAYFPVNEFHPDEVGIYALGVQPYDADPYTASGTKKPFWAWASQFDIGHNHTATGDPGVYIPQN